MCRRISIIFIVSSETFRLIYRIKYRIRAVFQPKSAILPEKDRFNAPYGENLKLILRLSQKKRNPVYLQIDIFLSFRWFREGVE